MIYEFTPKGVCTRKICFDISEDGAIQNISFTGGCEGNLLGISKLVVGMKASKVIDCLKGTTCGLKNTSCPDQLSLALQDALDKTNRRM